MSSSQPPKRHEADKYPQTWPVWIAIYTNADGAEQRDYYLSQQEAQNWQAANPDCEVQGSMACVLGNPYFEVVDTMYMPSSFTTHPITGSNLYGTGD